MKKTLLLMFVLACSNEPRSIEDTPPDDLAVPDTAPAVVAPAQPAAPQPASPQQPDAPPDSPQAPSIAVLESVRVGHHPDFDRIVFQFSGTPPEHKIEYIDRPVRACGSGDVVPFPGDAWLSIQFQPANAHTDEGKPSIANRDMTIVNRNLKQLKLICDFEAVVEWIAAVGSPGKFKVLELKEPTRVVVDIVR